MRGTVMIEWGGVRQSDFAAGRAKLEHEIPK
jgi:hypothetical protein